ncbi:MAG: hypothetical protein J6866_06030, partial [Victivallales bacterium]|nr:hypothetical protein [Victivallales bacterium]
VARLRLPGDTMAQRLHGVLVPKVGDGNANTVVSLMILPLTAAELAALDDQGKIEVLKPFLIYGGEAISIRQYKNPRLNLDTILFIGEVQPSKAAICYLYPQSDHTLCLGALIPEEMFSSDMGTFLAITDSLTWRATLPGAGK